MFTSTHKKPQRLSEKLVLQTALELQVQLYYKNCGQAGKTSTMCFSQGHNNAETSQASNIQSYTCKQVPHHIAPHI